MSEDVTKFLDNIIDGECWVYGNVFLDGFVCEGKRGVLAMVVKSVVCGSLFGESMKKYEGSRNGILLRGVGSSIIDLRRREVGDEVIYNSLVCVRDDFLRESEMRDYGDVLWMKRGVRVYGAVGAGMIKCLEEVA